MPAQQSRAVGGAVAFYSRFPATCGHSMRQCPHRRWKEPSAGPWPWEREAGAHQRHAALCHPPKVTASAGEPCLGVSNWAPKVNGNFWPSLLCASFPHLYSEADVSSSRKNMKCVKSHPRSLCVPWRGQGGPAAEEAHHAQSATASEAFLDKVCGYVLSDKEEKKYWVTTYAPHEIMNLWLVLMQIQTDAYQKDSLQSCKNPKLRHLSPSVSMLMFFGMFGFGLF